MYTETRRVGLVDTSHHTKRTRVGHAGNELIVSRFGIEVSVFAVLVRIFAHVGAYSEGRVADASSLISLLIFFSAQSSRLFIEIISICG